jgi:preprotein translocase subunit SecA
MDEAVTVAFAQRKERLVGIGNEGILTRELATVLDKSPEPISQQDIINLLTQLPQGTKAGFDKKTHQRVVVRTNRLNYFFYAAKLIEGGGAKDLTDLVLEHLERALELYKNAWGLAEWKQWSNNSLSDLPGQVQSSLMTKMGEEWLKLNANQSLVSLSDEEKDTVIAQLGRNILTANFRQLILNVISSLWIDYLTEMEGLRISIGLEAYAQRDPLVAYKNKASSLFQELLANVRQGVISRIFTFRPRNLASLAASERNEAAPQTVDPNLTMVEGKPDGKAPPTAQPEPGSSEPNQSEATRNDTESVGRSKRRRHNRR